MIEVVNLKKSYDYYEKEQGFKNSVKNIFHRKKLIKEAVKGISFQVGGNEIVGFIGPNGAGKTTTLKMLSGILYPTSGMALVGGYIPWERKKQFKMNMSIVMGQKSQLNWDLPAIESFHLIKCIYEIGDKEYGRNLEELVEVLDAKDLLKVQVRRLSLGERMKVELIGSLLHKPKVVFLDEPTIGLDFLSQKSIREFIKAYNQENNATIILTSHYMKDIESLCNRTMLINRGNVVYDGNLTDISGILNQHKIIKLQFSQNVAEKDINTYGNILQYDGIHAQLEVEKQELKEIAKRMLEYLPVLDLNVEDLPIEDVIASLYREGDE